MKLYRVVEREDCWALHNPASEYRDWLNVPRDGRWIFNGDYENPTFSPSINESVGPFPDGRMERNHFIITAGQVQFCGDCTHKLAGQTVDIPFLTEVEMMMHWPDVAGC